MEPEVCQKLWELLSSSCYFLSTNLESIGSKLLNELCSGDVRLVVDLDFLVHLELCFHCLLVVGISELQLVNGAVIWHVLDKADFVIVHATFHEIEVIDSPSWLIVWELLSKSIEVRIIRRFVFTRGLSRLHKFATRIGTFRNSEHSPFDLTLCKFGKFLSGFLCKIESSRYHRFYFFELYFYNYFAASHILQTT